MITGATLQYSAATGTAPLPGRNNFPLYENNTAWFSTSVTIPDPHFNLAGGMPAYAASTLTPNRSPALGRSNQAAFDAVTTAMTEKKDIDGNPRHNDGIDTGCYEGTGSVRGFRLQWNMRSIYISTKADNESEHPAILFDNAEGAYVKWWVETVEIKSSSYSLVLGYNAGEGNTDNLGIFKLKSGSSANTGNSPIDRGRIVLHSNLGSYLPRH